MDGSGAEDGASVIALLLLGDDEEDDEPTLSASAAGLASLRVHALADAIAITQNAIEIWSGLGRRLRIC
jgi:hypothetical protein